MRRWCGDHGFRCADQMQGQMHVHVTEMDPPAPLVGQFFHHFRGREGAGTGPGRAWEGPVSPGKAPGEPGRGPERRTARGSRRGGRPRPVRLRSALRVSVCVTGRVQLGVF
ncbi:hypothetical protein GTU99_22620 [Streptomyces sp. PRKS01-65]|nr:hypothetical protein [Streptomyces harenosi]